MIARKDPYIEQAYEKLENISQDEIKRLEYEARENPTMESEEIAKKLKD